MEITELNAIELNAIELNVSEQERIRREKLETLQQAGNDPFHQTTYHVTNYTTDITNDYDNHEGKVVSIAGRLLAKRVMGKATFITLQDRYGRLQAYVAGKGIGEDVYQTFTTYDIGDILGLSGEVFKTKTGEVSIRAAEVVLLAKSLQVLPEKYHGLTDTEARYRRRYVDLIINPEIRDTFEKRTKIIKGIRAFLDNRNYLEVDTPILQTVSGGAAARPFNTHHNALDIDMELRIALELPLKRLVVGGFDRVYELAKVFRNEGISTRHNPEFIMLELYEAYTDYHGMMELAENLLRELAVKITGSTTITYGEHTMDWGKPFAKITMVEAVKKYADVDFDAITTVEEAREAAKAKGLHFEKRHGKGDILNLFFEEYAEKHLIEPTFLMDHPVEISPLTKRKPDKPEYTERFELFIAGRELANAYTELNDPIDQRARFMHQEAMRAAGDDEANKIDEDFLLAMEYGMPPMGGMGIGVERLIMYLTNAASIRDVIFFPAMKPIK